MFGIDAGPTSDLDLVLVPPADYGDGDGGDGADGSEVQAVTKGPQAAPLKKLQKKLFFKNRLVLADMLLLLHV
jgi:hypothetical protein